MRILVFNWRDPKHPQAGGAEEYLFQVLKEWSKQGHKIDVFCGSWQGALKYEHRDNLTIIRKGNRFTTYLHAPLEYLLKLRKNNYDLIIDSINGMPWFTPLFSRKRKCAIFYHAVKDIFFKELPFPLSIIGFIIEKIALPLIYRKTKFITISKTTKLELSSLGIPEKNISIVYAGLDHRKYSPGTKSKKPILVYLGRLMRYKRVGLLFSIFKKIQKQVPEAHLIIAGRGEEYETLLNTLQKDNLKNIEIRGFISEKEKITLLQKAWLQLSASQKEGWGLTIIEGNACSTPSICFNVPGLNEAISQNKTGFLVETEEEFASKGISLLKNKKLLEKMSKNSVSWSKNFTWKKTAEEIMNHLTYS